MEHDKLVQYVPDLHDHNLPVRIFPGLVSSRAILIPHCNSSQGITSRGRLGITPSLNAQPIVNPWFQDPNDKVALTQAIKTLLTTANQGTVLPGAGEAMH